MKGKVTIDMQHIEILIFYFMLVYHRIKKGRHSMLRIDSVCDTSKI